MSSHWSAYSGRRHSFKLVEATERTQESVSDHRHEKENKMLFLSGVGSRVVRLTTVGNFEKSWMERPQDEQDLPEEDTPGLAQDGPADLDDVADGLLGLVRGDCVQEVGGFSLFSDCAQQGHLGEFAVVEATALELPARVPLVPGQGGLADDPGAVEPARLDRTVPVQPAVKRALLARCYICEKKKLLAR
jgi:hypothetical protein